MAPLPEVGRAPPCLVLRRCTDRQVRRGLLGVVGDQAVDELVNGAGLGQVPLAGLVGQFGPGEALVTLAGLVLGLLALLPLGLGSIAGLLPLGLLGLLTGLTLGLLGLAGGVANGLLERVDVAPGGVGDTLDLVAHGAAD